MLLVGNCFMFMVFSIYTVFNYMVNGEKTYNALATIIQLFSCTVIIVAVFGIAFAGQFVRSEVMLLRMNNVTSFLCFSFFFQAKKTGSIVHKILVFEENKANVKNLMAFSHQLLHRQPKFSCGLFSFDSKLAFSVNIVDSTTESPIDFI